MCTVIVHVPEVAGDPVRLLAVRDEDPGRAWDALGESWPEAYPGVIGVRDRRAGGAWLAADPAAGRVAVILNRADQIPDDGAPLDSRGHVVLDAIAGTRPSGSPRTHGFNLVEADAQGARVIMWDGDGVRTVALESGIHMIAHDDVDDPATARITAWRSAFAAPGPGERWYEPWLDTLERTSAVGPVDDRAIVRDNRPFGYPTLTLLACAASIDAAGARVLYGEFDEPGAWNRLSLR
ncbi:NRDE family protein [Microbacterium telephonicum]|uniref:Transport and Golgi organization protein 2 n=1 Tax=Microbacterium telephonicum TaxID=1714841 RepID=A0A498CLT9_9MICO|nr:NRDE family protein [Microbacterium telephonicum]RLK52768.1 transport and Golgi organization protein 2 [Microbacterium telephonicum]